MKIVITEQGNEFHEGSIQMFLSGLLAAIAGLYEIIPEDAREGFDKLVITGMFKAIDLGHKTEHRDPDLAVAVDTSLLESMMQKFKDGEEDA